MQLDGVDLWRYERNPKRHLDSRANGHGGRMTDHHAHGQLVATFW